MITTLCEFLFPGSFVSESDVRTVATREPPLDIPPAAFAYRFYNVAKETVTLDGGEVMTVYGKLRSVSGWHYPEAQVFTVDEVKALHDCDHDIRNMAANGWARMVRSRHGNWQPFGDDDRLVDAHGMPWEAVRGDRCGECGQEPDACYCAEEAEPKEL